MKPDYERVLELLQSTPDRYYPTWEIANSIKAQDNSVQRALHQLRVDKGISNIQSRPHNLTRVKEYAWVADVGGKLPAHQESNNPCSAMVNGKTCGGFYYRGKNCTKCNNLTGRGYA